MSKPALALIFALACSMGSPLPVQAASVSLPGFSVQVPDADGWRRVESGKDSARFEQDSAEGLIRLEFATVRTDDKAADESFLKGAEAGLEAQFVERGLLSRHYNYTSTQGAACLLYDAIIRQKAGEPGLEFRKGWICRLPTDKSTVARLEAVRFSDSRNEDSEKRFLDLADSVLRTAEFDGKP